MKEVFSNVYQNYQYRSLEAQNFNALYVVVKQTEYDDLTRHVWDPFSQDILNQRHKTVWEEGTKMIAEFSEPQMQAQLQDFYDTLGKDKK